MSDQKSFWDQLNEQIESLSETLGLPADFLHDLVLEVDDDWSFIVKLHAVLEAAVNELMVTKLDKSVAEMLTERLSLSFRMDILRVSGVISKDDAQRMQTLGKLRNRLVHNVNQTNFELIALVDTEGKRKDFGDSYIHPHWRPLLDKHKGHPEWMARYLLWFSVLQVVSITKGEKQKAQIMTALDKVTST